MVVRTDADACMVTAMGGAIITVWDGHKTVAKAKKLMPGAGGWLLTMYDGCWINPKARAGTKVTNVPQPQYLLLRDRRQVMKEMEGLLKQIRLYDEK